MTFPDMLKIIPLSRSPDVTVRVPGSKSITNRALVLAATQGKAYGSCVLSGALQSEDTIAMIESLAALGFVIEPDWAKSQIRVSSPDRERIIPKSAAKLFVGNSGTTMRFLTALVSLGTGTFRLDGIPRMRERPIEDLLAGLRQLGVNAISENNNGCPPVVIYANGIRGGIARLKGNVSSQFLSGLLMAAPLAECDLTIHVDGPLVSVPYVRMTVEMMKHFGYAVNVLDDARIHIPGRQCCGTSAYEIEPDASAASYFFGAAAITNGKVTVLRKGWRHTNHPTDAQIGVDLQGDWRFVDLLQEMGCHVKKTQFTYLINSRSIESDPIARGPLPTGRRSDWAPFGNTLHGATLRGIDVDMNDISDTVMTLAAVACFAEGPTTIRNVAHIRHKETDRLAALATELRRVGAEVDEFADGLTISPRPLHGGEIETYNDHRMAMSMALIGLRVPGIVIKNPGCVAKTYPDFFEDLENLRG
jgi:3-phosphoshikimate 1-carboxyvinyltransferase